MLQNQELTVRAYTDAAPGSGGMGSVELGLIFTEGGSQYGGAVYCAGPGSSWTSEGGTLTVSIPSLTKLGSCLAEPGDGELRACL